MDVIVDGARNFAVEGTPADALAVVAAANDWLRQRGRAMQAVVVDGQDIPPDSLAKSLAGRATDSIQTLEIQSETLGVLVDDCLATLQQHVPELPVACRSLAQVFQGETPDAGFDPFHQLAEIWGTVKERQLMVAAILGIDLDNLEVDGESFKQLHDELNGCLEEAATAIENGDTVSLGDLLEYELAPRAERESTIVALLQEQSPAKQAG